MVGGAAFGATDRPRLLQLLLLHTLLGGSNTAAMTHRASHAATAVPPVSIPVSVPPLSCVSIASPVSDWPSGLAADLHQRQSEARGILDAMRHAAAHQLHTHDHPSFACASGGPVSPLPRPHRPPLVPLIVLREFLLATTRMHRQISQQHFTNRLFTSVAFHARQTAATRCPPVQCAVESRLTCLPPELAIKLPTRFILQYLPEITSICAVLCAPRENTSPVVPHAHAVSPPSTTFRVDWLCLHSGAFTALLDLVEQLFLVDLHPHDEAMMAKPAVPTGKSDAECAAAAWMKRLPKLKPSHALSDDDSTRTRRAAASRHKRMHVTGPHSCPHVVLSVCGVLPCVHRLDVVEGWLSGLDSQLSLGVFARARTVQSVHRQRHREIHEGETTG